MVNVEIWQRQPGEPGKWYSRFEVYRLLGPNRTIEEAYRLVAHAEGLRGAHPGASWTEIRKRWSWRQRAEAWDESERQTLRQAEATRRFDARQTRLQRIASVQALSFGLLEQALRDYNLAQLTPNPTPEQIAAMSEEVLALIPNLRRIFAETLKAQRLEFGEATEIIDANDNHAIADDVRRMLDKVYGSNQSSA